MLTWYCLSLSWFIFLFPIFSSLVFQKTYNTLFEIKWVCHLTSCWEVLNDWFPSTCVCCEIHMLAVFLILYPTLPLFWGTQGILSGSQFLWDWWVITDPRPPVKFMTKQRFEAGFLQLNPRPSTVSWLTLWIMLFVTQKWFPFSKKSTVRSSPEDMLWD